MEVIRDFFDFPKFDFQDKTILKLTYSYVLLDSTFAILVDRCKFWLWFSAYFFLPLSFEFKIHICHSSLPLNFRESKNNASLYISVSPYHTLLAVFMHM